jgi:hypothetical protein
MRAHPTPTLRHGPATRWGRWNFHLLAVFAPVLVLTGIAGFLLPPALALMSGAAPYNVFHIVCGSLGAGLVLARRPRPIAAFNLGFGAVDLYQAAAGLTGTFPAALFALRPADHVVHVVLGVLLCAVGARGLGTPSPTQEPT